MVGGPLFVVGFHFEDWPPSSLKWYSLILRFLAWTISKKWCLRMFKEMFSFFNFSRLTATTWFSWNQPIEWKCLFGATGAETILGPLRWLSTGDSHHGRWDWQCVTSWRKVLCIWINSFSIQEGLERVSRHVQSWINYGWTGCVVRWPG